MDKIFIYNRNIYVVDDEGNYTTQDTFPQCDNFVTTCLEYSFASRLIPCPDDYRQQLLFLRPTVDEDTINEDQVIKKELPELQTLLSIREVDNRHLDLVGLCNVLDDYASSDIFPDGSQILPVDENIEFYNFRFDLLNKGILLSYIKKDALNLFPVKPFYIESITRTIARGILEELKELETAVILFVDANIYALAIWSDGEILVEFSERTQEENKQFSAEYFVGVIEDLTEIAKLEINKFKLPNYQKVFLVTADEIRVLLSQKQYLINRVYRFIDIPLVELISKGLGRLELGVSGVEEQTEIKPLNLSINDLEIYALHKKYQELLQQKRERTQILMGLITAFSPLFISIMTSILIYVMTYIYGAYLDRQITELRDKTNESMRIKVSLDKIAENLEWYRDWFKQVNLVQNNKDVGLFFLREIDTSASKDVLFKKINLLKNGNFNVEAEGQRENNIVSFVEKIENNTLINSNKEKMFLNIKKENPKERKVSLELKGVYSVLEVEEQKKQNNPK